MLKLVLLVKVDLKSMITVQIQNIVFLFEVVVTIQMTVNVVHELQQD